MYCSANADCNADKHALEEEAKVSGNRSTIKGTGTKDNYNIVNDCDEKEEVNVCGDAPTIKGKCYKAPIGTRPAIYSILGIIESLIEPQRLVVGEMGFGGVLGINFMKLLLTLLSWLVRRFDLVSCCLTAHGRTLEITSKDVYHILRISYEGFSVKKARKVDNIWEFKSLLGLGGQSVVLKDLRNQLCEMETEG